MVVYLVNFPVPDRSQGVFGQASGTRCCFSPVLLNLESAQSESGYGIVNGCVTLPRKARLFKDDHNFLRCRPAT